MKLPLVVSEAVRQAGVEVYFADRSVTSVWNKDRDEGEPIYYGGWYWHRSHRGRVIQTDEDGPFKSESAAIRDAYIKLQLRAHRQGTR